MLISSVVLVNGRLPGGAYHRPQQYTHPVIQIIPYAHRGVDFVRVVRQFPNFQHQRTAVDRFQRNDNAQLFQLWQIFIFQRIAHHFVHLRPFLNIQIEPTVLTFRFEFFSQAGIESLLAPLDSTKVDRNEQSHRDPVQSVRKTFNTKDNLQLKHETN
ncbi:conserved hypothetical protein [Trichinella spiralis]|uniref:hypothetical protein n=1 Tax=Trichinella spiralis TaxID=6334 RepID=UPI0001EFC96C|nr:conserved hypothetical protein [Trichinella spiralis]